MTGASGDPIEQVHRPHAGPGRRASAAPRRAARAGRPGTTADPLAWPAARIPWPCCPSSIATTLLVERQGESGFRLHNLFRMFLLERSPREGQDVAATRTRGLYGIAPGTQSPSEHTRPDGQILPHIPQLVRSFLRSTQRPLQAVKPEGQMRGLQTPCMHPSLARQGWLHIPQCERLASRFTQAPLQLVNPVAQTTTQEPPTQL